MRTARSNNSKGFTLMEVLISIGIFAILTGLILVNYRRGNDDSALTKDVALIMANVRLAQEQTASGKSIKHCAYYTGQACSVNADCPAADNSCVSGIPQGGYAVVFSCPDQTGGDPTNHTTNNYPLAYYGRTQYGLFAENRSCLKTSGDGCFPVQPSAVDPLKVPGVSDERVSYVEWGTLGAGYRGDTLQQAITLQPVVQIKNIRLTSRAGQTLACGQQSLWVGSPTGVPNSNGATVQASFQMQALVHFSSPDGRTLLISDNLASGPPDAAYAVLPTNPWSTLEIMVGLTTRPGDCRKVTMTDAGVVKQEVDADCLL